MPTKKKHAEPDRSYIQKIPLMIPASITPYKLVSEEDYTHFRDIEKRYGASTQSTKLSVIKDLMIVLFSILATETVRTPFQQLSLGLILASVISLIVLIVIVYCYYWWQE